MRGKKGCACSISRREIQFRVFGALLVLGRRDTDSGVDDIGLNIVIYTGRCTPGKYISPAQYMTEN
jgi:hypothetical protein